MTNQTKFIDEEVLSLLEYFMDKRMKKHLETEEPDEEKQERITQYFKDFYALLAALKEMKTTKNQKFICEIITIAFTEPSEYFRIVEYTEDRMKDAMLKSLMSLAGKTEVAHD